MSPSPSANRLGDSASPYLRQHATNPVAWREWSEEAFAEAVERDVPVILSVGYAACHWCHVMAHESFEDPALAAQMNDGFVCIKVDREERPDIDAIYMAATVAMTGQGGWPMTCFLTPGGEPFYCGTYYPPQPRSGMPGFGQILSAISDTWAHRRDEVMAASQNIAEHLRVNAGPIPTGPGIDGELITQAVAAILHDEDPRAGGFGGAPKFPPSMVLEALLRYAELGGDPQAQAAVTRACTSMARGGIYDQLAGGFARYSVDANWVVPHFEKMLYDNALLLRVYAHLARRTGDPIATRVTEETVAFLDESLWTGHGYASSLDADTDGVEGLTYVWTPAQLREVLGEDDGAWAATLFAVTEAGSFENGFSTLQLPADPDRVDPDGVDPETVDPHGAERYATVRAKLLAHRAMRPQPARDDKVIVGWNALAITALTEAGSTLDRPDWIERAADTANRLWELHLADGVLRRSSLGGVVGEPLAALEDHAAFVTALLTLHQVTGDVDWRDRALHLLDRSITVFADPEAPGAWFDAPAGSLLVRPRDPADGATPAGGSLMAEALLLAGQLAPDADAPRYAQLGDQTLARSGLILQRMPRSAGHWLAVAGARLAGPLQIAVAETSDSTGDLARAVRRRAPGGTVVVAGRRDALPLLTDRGPSGDVDAAYLCRGQTCDLPVTDADALDFG